MIKKPFVKQLFGSIPDDFTDDYYLNQEFEFQNKPAIKEKMNETELLTKVVTAITYLYRADGVAPNVIISALPNKKIYLSINRYNDSTDRFKKNIIFKSTKDNVEKVLMDAVKFLIKQKKNTKNPIEELKELIEDEA